MQLTTILDLIKLNWISMVEGPINLPCLLVYSDNVYHNQKKQ